MIKILVIDDDKLIRWSLNEIFSQEGYKVDAAATTQEALEQAETIHYDLIFADLEINEENGFEMLKKIGKLQPSAQVIILSALSKTEIEPSLGNLNIFSIFEKPFKGEQIRSIAKEALNLTNYDKGGGHRLREKNKGKEL